eukprot:Hpha_TRINITY_DN18623_c0_g1::TRINITY_DN18623_c0_g1_i1::g.115697::m.115697/K00759/APRT, apt; adenine phosphoribosyltransferase
MWSIRRATTAAAAAACGCALGSFVPAAQAGAYQGSELKATPSGLTVRVAGLERQFPKREVKPGLKVALFNPLGDWELNEKLGQALKARVPRDVDYLLMPDGKAQALLHVLGRETGLPTMVARKEKKPYMKEPILEGVRNQCMTSLKKEAFYLGADDVAKLKGKKVLIVDDVVSTGGSIKAMRNLLSQTECVLAAPAHVICAFTEGGERDEVIALGNLPLNAPEW